MSQDHKVTNEEKITALKRELAMRRNVYAKRVREGKMRQSDADREIAIFEAILDDYLDREWA